MTAARPCPACAEPRSEAVFSVPALRLGGGFKTPPGDFVFRRCASCATTFIDQLPDERLLASYYESPLYHFSQEARPLSLPRRLHLRLSRPLPAGAPGRHLDFGCGPGDYLDFSRSLGWRAQGVEWSEASARAARRRGFDVSLAAEAASLADASFDFVSLVHVLEHVPQPASLLALLAKKLAPGGTLFIEVPVLNHEHRLFGRHFSMIQAPLHLQFLSDAAIGALAGKAGLRLERARNNIWAPVHYSWSLIETLDDRLGLDWTWRRRLGLAALAAPATLLVAAAATALGASTEARQFYLKRA